MSVTWSPTDRDLTRTALSNNNLTITGVTNTYFGSARATQSRSSGLRYFEAKCDLFVTNFMMLGISTSATALDIDPGSVSTGWVAFPYSNNVNKRNNNAYSALGAGGGLATVYQVAIDLDSGKLWFGNNNNWYGGDPAAGTGAHYTGVTGTLFPIACVRGGTATQWTARFALADFSYAPPSGFLAWDTSAIESVIDSLTLSETYSLLESTMLLDLGAITETVYGHQVGQYFDGAPSVSVADAPRALSLLMSDPLAATDLLSAPPSIALLDDRPATTDAPSAYGVGIGWAMDAAAMTDTAALLAWGVAADANALSERADTLAITARAETMHGEDALSGALILSVLAAKTYTAMDALSAVVAVPVLDTVAAVDSGLLGLLITPLADGGVTVDQTGGALSISGLLEEVQALESWPIQSRLLCTFADHSVALDELLARGQMICVVNIETGAVSMYRAPFARSVCYAAGTLYVATDSGLLALTGDNDNGVAVPWSFRSGFANLGADQLKTVQDVNVLAEGVPATLCVVHNRTGQKIEYRYPLARTPMSAPRDQVIHCGKGAQSVYWQIGAYGAGEAEIHEVRPRVTLLSRRR